ncbi:hypothetical protein PVM12_10770 [Enterobacter soli]|uniref:hypothetical protein n=1 Tax=Enterobacter soli TaxID=885040 RepID=UPI002379BE7B|nr:hypothetical protein [Enterobacter soli]MDD9244527.1 hypothetical protein [Enterobacter soli]
MKYLVLLLVLVAGSSNATRFITPELQEKMNRVQGMILSSGNVCNHVTEVKKYLTSMEVACDNRDYIIIHKGMSYTVNDKNN